MKASSINLGVPTSTDVFQLRTRAGLSQQTAAELCMTTRGTWANWERGRRKMPALTWRWFQERLEVRDPSIFSE